MPVSLIRDYKTALLVKIGENVQTNFETYSVSSCDSLIFFISSVKVEVTNIAVLKVGLSYCQFSTDLEILEDLGDDKRVHEDLSHLHVQRLHQVEILQSLKLLIFCQEISFKKFDIFSINIFSRKFPQFSFQKFQDRKNKLKTNQCIFYDFSKLSIL